MMVTCFDGSILDLRRLERTNWKCRDDNDKAKVWDRQFDVDCCWQCCKG